MNSVDPGGFQSAIVIWLAIAVGVVLSLVALAVSLMRGRQVKSLMERQQQDGARHVLPEFEKNGQSADASMVTVS